MSDRADISATQEDYLEAILRLARLNGAARAGDIATEVSVHKSTVTAALRALTEKGLVDYAPYGAATLTDEGQRIAERVSRNHELIRGFLTELLLVDDATAEENACRMEHVMDKSVLDRLVLFAHYFRDCLEGTTSEGFREYFDRVTHQG